MSRIEVGQENSAPIELYYEDHGDGSPVLLVHGWPLSGASWEKQVGALLAAGHRVVTYDRRGFGQSSKPSVGYDYDTFAEDLHRLVTRLDLRQCTLVGFSMGGGEVARYLGKYGTERVSRACFISAITPFLLRTADNPGGEEQGGFDATRKAIAADRMAFLDGFFGKFFNTDSLAHDRISPAAVRACWNVAAQASAKGTHDSVGAWLTDFRPDISRIDIPVLIIHGDDDRILPAAVSAAPLAKLLPEARLVMVEGGPHGIIWTHADIVNRELLRFVAASAQAVTA